MSTFCFSQTTTFKYLPQTVRVQYQTWWGTFERIQAFNLNVSTIRASTGASLSGATDPRYYVFKSREEMLEFLNGRMLHIKAYPNLNWNPVPTDG